MGGPTAYVTEEKKIGGVKIMPVHRNPITQSLHLPYKPLESTLYDEKLFIEIVFMQNLSRPYA